MALLLPRIVAFGVETMIFLAAISTGRAELPPQVYQQYQNEAPEAPSLTVQSVDRTEKIEKEFTLITIVAGAKIDKVTRSATGLKAGDIIRIVYPHRRDRQMVPGPSQPEILKKGRSYPAFLEKQKDGTYGLAARGYSFRLIE